MLECIETVSYGFFVACCCSEHQAHHRTLFLFSQEQYAIIARAHDITVMSSDRKDLIRDLLRVHICNAQCMCNLLVFQHLKTPQRGFAGQILLEPFSESYREVDAASH